MTGTADTEAFEFEQIYGLEVVVIPTHEPMIRKDMPDLVYLNQDGKFRNIINDIKEKQEIGQPVLLGTASIENSEYISKLLQKEKIKHEVLNAKQHKKESMIIAQAGRPGAVTIARLIKLRRNGRKDIKKLLMLADCTLLVQNGMSLGELIIN